MRSLIYSIPARIARPLFPDILWRMPGSDPVLYLTFDDGPTAEGTGPLLDLLDRFGARGTFFLLGAHAERLPDDVRRIVAGGHAIGNHSYAHIDPWTSSRRRLVDELDRADRLLSELSGSPVRLARPPYGRLRPAFAGWCRRKGCRVVMWDVVSGDFDRRVSPGAAASAVQREARAGSIVVFHDNPESRVTMLGALERILDYFSNAGWRFEALPEAA